MAFQSLDTLNCDFRFCNSLLTLSYLYIVCYVAVDYCGICLTLMTYMLYSKIPRKHRKNLFSGSQFVSCLVCFWSNMLDGKVIEHGRAFSRQRFFLFHLSLSKPSHPLSLLFSSPLQRQSDKHFSYR
ncbi:hypothetical protein RIF29_22060 [Crotalaria pallida]|uniref:Uncharacterized protein n=1 Tax=Crotalaria pallida TaxID=3830 RepID=A0AAN9IA12_CROPI